MREESKVFLVSGYLNLEQRWAIAVVAVSFGEAAVIAERRVGFTVESIALIGNECIVDESA
jgi:hypothetical protein